MLRRKSRADGSRWGGVQGYWAPEAGAVTASKPRFALLTLELHKLTALVNVTDELLKDATGLDGTIK
jgi:HK97 family phage major capsid protein